MKKPKCVFLLARVYKQVIFKSSGYGNYINLLFSTETSLI